MIAIQKARIVNLSELATRLSSIGSTGHVTKPSLMFSHIQQSDKLVVEQVIRMNSDQIPLYLSQNPFPIQCLSSPLRMGAERMNSILHSLPPNVAVEFANAAFFQLYRSAEINDLVQTLRKSIHNRQFVHKIETFCCKLFKCGFCQLFALQPQQNQLIANFDNDSFTLQIPLGRGIVGSCARDGRVTIYQSTKDSDFYEPEIDDFLNIGTNPSMLIPVFDSSSNFVISVLLVHSPKIGAVFTPEDHQLGEILSSQISPFLTTYVEHLEKEDDHTLRTEVAHAVKSLLGKNTLEEFLSTTLSVVQRTIGANDAELFIYDGSQSMLFVFEAQMSHDGKQTFARKYFTAKSGIPFHVVESLSVFNVPRLTPEKCEFFSRELDLPALGNPYIAVPVFGIDKKPIAVLAAYGKRNTNYFSPLESAALQQIAVQIGVNLFNILVSQEAVEVSRSENCDRGSFEKPMKAILQAFGSKTVSSRIVQVCEAIAKELSKRINVDLVAIWEVNPTGKLIQHYIMKSTNPFAQIVNPPPVVQNVVKTQKHVQCSVASEVKLMIGGFDEEINYKSYSNLTYPVVSSDNISKWVIMVENSMSSQGRFSDADLASLSDFSMFLLLISEIMNIQTQFQTSVSIMQVLRSMIQKLTPVKSDILPKVLLELCTHIGADVYGLFQMDSLTESLCLLSSNSENAPKTVTVTQGILGNVATNNQPIIVSQLQSNPLYNPTTDSLGFLNPSSALVLRIKNDFVMEFVGQTPSRFSSVDLSIAMESSDLLVHAFEIGRNFTDLSEVSLSGLNAEQRSNYMSRSASPTRSDLEEFSDRLFNILSYSEDDRVVMLLKMFVSLGVVRKLQVPFQKLVEFICALRNTYNATPYHNWTHACDVAQFVFSCIMRGRLRQFLSDLELFALLLAAISHDVNHQGLNNAFHKKARTPLGILYEERPVMEMHHCATAIRLLSVPEHNILEGIESTAEKAHFYEFFLKIILATDMDKHFAYIKEFEEMINDFDKRNERHRLLLAQIVMKCGDVSNTTRAFETASDMAHALTDEFFKQGDLERVLGIEVTPMCDRTTANHISTSQVGFYGFLASPLLTALGKFLPSLADNTDQLEKNKKTWEQQKMQWESSKQ